MPRKGEGIRGAKPKGEGGKQLEVEKVSQPVVVL